MFWALSDFALKLLEIPSEKELLWYVAREVVGRMGFVDCVIYLIDAENQRLRQVAAIGAKNPRDDQIVNALEIPLGEGITGQVAQSGTPLVIGDLRADSRYIPDMEPALSEICVPLIIDGDVVGVIDCEDPRANRFGDRHLEILNTIAAMTSAKLKLIAEAYRVAARTEELYSLNSHASRWRTAVSALRRSSTSSRSWLLRL